MAAQYHLLAVTESVTALLFVNRVRLFSRFYTFI